MSLLMEMNSSALSKLNLQEPSERSIGISNLGFYLNVLDLMSSSKKISTLKNYLAFQRAILND